MDKSKNRTGIKGGTKKWNRKQKKTKGHETTS